MRDRFRLRSPLGRALGFGPSRSGFADWWAERVTAVALVPLVLWLAAGLTMHGSEYTAMIGWLDSTASVVLMSLLLITLFRHTVLGLQVVIEDYVHSGRKTWVLLLVRFVCTVLAAIGIFSTLRIGLLH